MASDEQGSNRVFDLFEAVGRIEAKVDGLKEAATSRDGKIEELTDRVRDNAHQAVNTGQQLTGQMDHVQISMRGNSDKLDGLDGRVQRLEAPVAHAMAARMRRQKIWVRAVAVATGVSTVMWMFVEPIWRVMVEFVAHHWTGGGPQ